MFQSVAGSQREQLPAGRPTQAAAQNVVVPGQDLVGGPGAVSQPPLGAEGHSAPGGSDASTVQMEVGGAGADIPVGQRPSMQVMSATPNGLVCTMTPEAWQQIMAAGLFNLHPPAGVQQQQGPISGSTGFQQYRQQQRQLQHQEPQPGPSGIQSVQTRGPYMPKGRREDVEERPLTREEFWEVRNPSRPSSWAASGITGTLLTEIRAEYDLSNYPYNSQVTFLVYTYVEVHGIRRLLRIRSIPEN